MKSLLLALIITGSIATARSQGTVAFINGPASTVNAPVYESDGATKLSGSQFMAGLFGGPNMNSLTSIAMTGFLSGNSAGYFDGGVQTITTVSAGAIAWVQVDVWNTAVGGSFAQAHDSGVPNAWWQSAPFTVQTGNPFGNPSLPGALTGLGFSPVYLNSVPEPSSSTLILAGLVIIAGIHLHPRLGRFGLCGNAGSAPLLSKPRSALMKRLFLTAALGVVCISASAQGTLNFANGGAGLQAKVTDWSTGVGLSGSAWSADLFWAPGVVADPTRLTALNEPATFSTVASQAGFFFGGPRTVPIAPGVITAQIRVWDTASGSTWAQALVAPSSLLGESILFQVQLADPNAAPPGIPTTMTGLNGHPWQVAILIPEPSTLALAGFGLAGLLTLRRRLN